VEKLYFILGNLPIYTTKNGKNFIIHCK
jgi:hypothetical protein